MPQFITPVAGRLTQPFIPGIHYGVDIGATDHSTVVASEAGRVTFEGTWGAGGNTIIITGNDGWKTYYCHLAKFLVNIGASVTQGQAIAQSGGALGEQGAGNAHGPHLHFEIHNPQGVTVNPQQYISVGGAPISSTASTTPTTTTPSQNSGGILGIITNTIKKGIEGTIIPGAGLPGNPLGAAASVSKNIPGVGTILSTAYATNKVANFVTQPNNWKRVAQFAAGAVLLAIVLVKTLSESDAVKSVAGLAAKAA